jgi:hypothetical protein
MTIPHLESDIIDDIALSLDEDVYGSNGDLTDKQINEHLIKNIRAETGYQFADAIPVEVVATLIRSVWEYEDRKYMGAIANTSGAAPPADNPREHSAPVWGLGVVRVRICGHRLEPQHFQAIDSNTIRAICPHCHTLRIEIDAEELGHDEA